MVKKKTVKAKETNSKKTPAEETDEEFMQRISKITASSKEKAKKEYAEMTQTKEVKELFEKGKELGKVFEEREECAKIVEQFKTKPPIINTVHINGVSVERTCDSKADEEKITLLKKHGFSFPSAYHNVSYNTIYFKTAGENVFLKRGGTRVQLPASNEDLPISIKDGDIISVGNNSYFLNTGDSTQSSETNKIDIMAFPNSEFRFYVSEQTTNPEPSFMDPSNVSEFVKRNTKNTIHTSKINKIELLKGIFMVTIVKSSSDANNFLKISSDYPQPKFMPASEMGATIMEKTLESMKKQSIKNYALISAIYLPKILEQRTKSGGVCHSILSYFELDNGILTIFGNSSPITVNGERLDKSLPATQPVVKYVLTRGRNYAVNLIDKSTNQINDPRVKAIMNRGYSASALQGNSEEENNSESKYKKIIKIAESTNDKLLLKFAKSKLTSSNQQAEMYRQIREREADKVTQEREAKEMLAAAEEIGDKKLIEVAKVQMASVNYQGPSEQFDSRAMQEQQKILSKIKQKMDEPLPPYNSV